jgi:hypothetical protein
MYVKHWGNIDTLMCACAAILNELIYVDRDTDKAQREEKKENMAIAAHGQYSFEIRYKLQ